MKKKNQNQNKQQKNHKHTKEDTIESTHDDWIEKTKVRAREMLARAVKENEQREEQRQAQRRARFGRWAPLVDALEGVVDATIFVAEEEVVDSPRALGKLLRVRESLLAPIDDDSAATADWTDFAFTIGLLARLAAEDHGERIAQLCNALVAALTARPQAFAKLFDLRDTLLAIVTAGSETSPAFARL